jgi:hypothetical protein
MKGGHSNVDLVMGVLDCDLGSAVRWIAERFHVPNVKVGRPSGKSLASPAPYRVGMHGSEWEIVVRSGMWGAMTAAERSVLVVLDCFKDSESGLTRLSYRAIMRYSGVKKMANVSSAIKELARMHALEVSRGQRVGITRECSAYRPTLDSPKFLELCNAVSLDAKQDIAQEREYRASQKRERERAARKPNGRSLQIVALNTTEAGGLRPPTPPAVCDSNSKPKVQREAPTCKGLNLSSPGEVHANKTLPLGQREISISEERVAELRRQAQMIRERYPEQEATP